MVRHAILPRTLEHIVVSLDHLKRKRSRNQILLLLLLVMTLRSLEYGSNV